MNQLVDSSALEEDDDEETIVVQKMVEQVVEVLPIPTPKAQPLAEARALVRLAHPPRFVQRASPQQRPPA